MSHHVHPARVGGLAAQFGDGAVRDFVDDAARDRLDGFFLLLGQPAKLAALALDFRRPPQLQLFLQADDGGRNFARLQAQHHALHFFANDVFGLHGDFDAAFDVGFDHTVQIVDVVQEHVVEVIHLRFDIARHRDVDQEHRPVLAPSDDRLASVPW